MPVLCSIVSCTLLSNRHRHTRTKFACVIGGIITPISVRFNTWYSVVNTLVSAPVLTVRGCAVASHMNIRESHIEFGIRKHRLNGAWTWYRRRAALSSRVQKPGHSMNPMGCLYWPSWRIESLLSTLLIRIALIKAILGCRFGLEAIL